MQKKQDSLLRFYDEDQGQLFVLCSQECKFLLIPQINIQKNVTNFSAFRLIIERRNSDGQSTSTAIPRFD